MPAKSSAGLQEGAVVEPAHAATVTTTKPITERRVQARIAFRVSLRYCVEALVNHDGAKTTKSHEDEQSPEASFANDLRGASCLLGL
jgi:hypothetical protein